MAVQYSMKHFHSVVVDMSQSNLAIVNVFLSSILYSHQPSMEKHDVHQNSCLKFNIFSFKRRLNECGRILNALERISPFRDVLSSFESTFYFFF